MKEENWEKVQENRKWEKQTAGDCNSRPKPLEMAKEL